jgi:hypothetical protein
MRRKLVALALLAAPLGGCAEYQARLAAQQAAARAAIDAADDRRCRSYGSVPGTQAYFECRTLLHTQRVNIAAAEDMQRQQNGVNMMMLGASILANSGR